MRRVRALKHLGRNSLMKLPLASYSADAPDLEVFSYIVEVPFAPIDIDVERLVREFGWDNKVDRFRIWNIPKMRGKTERNCPYLFFKKLDHEQDVLLLGRVDFSPYGERASSWMAISMLCNDDEYLNRFLSLFVNQPPAFHNLEEFIVVEKAWVNDENAILHFKALLVEPAVAKEALSEMPTKKERRILEYMYENCYYPMNPPRKEPKVAVQIATETPYHELRLTFEVERFKVAQEINKMLKNLHKVNVPKIDKTGKGEV